MVTGDAAVDVAVVGGGPAGLAAAIAVAERGLSAIVLERRELPADKACGEGLLPPAVLALERLGVTPYLAGSSVQRFAGVRFVQEDGSSVDATLPGAGGLGIRRTVLVDALTRRAAALGVQLWSQCPVRAVARHRDVARVRVDDGEVVARIVVAADGLHSPLRRAAGLAARPARRRRVAVRQHFGVRPWSDRVEVHTDRLGEAVVTPIADDAVNVNFVWEHGTDADATVAWHLDRFPALRLRLAGAPATSTMRGAGPMGVRTRRRIADRLVLIGDAAGFVDSISADGLSIAFNSALALGEHLPAALARDATAASLRGYERAARRLFRNYWAVTHGLLWIARRPRLRARLIRHLARHPAMCDAMMGGAMTLMLATT